MPDFAGPFSIDATSSWMAMASSFALGFLVGALPVGASEAVALAIGTIPSARVRGLVLLTFTAGHVLGKLPWYWLGAAGARVTSPRPGAWLTRAHDIAAAHPTMGATVAFSAAAISVPPFHLLVIAAGIVRSPLVPLALASLAGRLLRLGTIAAFPAAVDYFFTS